MSNMTRRSFVSAGLSSAAALALAACSGGGEGGEGGEALAPVAGLICLHDENSPYDLNFIKDFKAVCENMGIGYLVKTNIDEGTQIAPVLSFHGTKDRTVNTKCSVYLHEHLLATGHESRLYLLRGADHGGPEFWTPEVLGIVDGFLREKMD